MKAVVLHQPYATLVALGVKTIETRPAPPNGPMRPEGVRGLPGLAIEPGERIAIVAGRRLTTESKVGEWFIDRYRRGDRGSMFRLEGQHGPDRLPSSRVLLPLGAVVCTARVVDALPMVAEPGNPFGTGASLLIEDDDLLTYWCGDVSDEEAGVFDGQVPFGDFVPGRWGWLLADVERCDPIPVKGKQGVFLLPDDVIPRPS